MAGDDERLRVAERLFESEHRLQFLSDNLPDAMLYQVVFEADGSRRFTYLSHGVEVMHGLTADEVYADANRLYAQIHPDDLPAVVEAEQRSLRDGTLFVIEVRMIRPDGGPRWSLLRSMPRPGPRGSTIWDGLEIDVTAQTRERQALVLAETALRTRNTEMEQFVYTVSHDLKAPLVTITGFAGAIAAALQADDPTHVAKDVERIEAAARRMLALLEDLLQLSRLGGRADPPEPVALDGVIGEVLEVLRGTLEAHGVTVTVAPELPVVRGDRARLLQVAQNLIENACKYTGSQATPRIEIAARAANDPRATTLTVCDNGLGIEPANFEHVFGLFEKLDPRSAGTGVGLALVRRIVDQHGGRVWVESDGLGYGSTFCVQLPRAEPVR